MVTVQVRQKMCVYRAEGCPSLTASLCDPATRIEQKALVTRHHENGWAEAIHDRRRCTRAQGNDREWGFLRERLAGAPPEEGRHDKDCRNPKSHILHDAFPCELVACVFSGRPLLWDLALNLPKCAPTAAADGT